MPGKKEKVLKMNSKKEKKGGNTVYKNPTQAISSILEF